MDCSLVPASNVFTHTLDYFQIFDTGPVTGSVGAVATGNPVKLLKWVCVEIQLGSTSSSSSSASHLVIDGLFSLLSAALLWDEIVVAAHWHWQSKARDCSYLEPRVRGHSLFLPVSS